MINAIFDALSTIAQAFITLLTSIFSNIGTLIYTPGSGSDPGQLTTLGTLLLIALGTGLVMWAFYFIRNLIRVRKNG